MDLTAFSRLMGLSSEDLPLVSYQVFVKSKKGTALNHITINGVDKLLSNGSTEVGLNGVNIIEETVLVHGDILRSVSKQLDRDSNRIILSALYSMFSPDRW